MEYTHFKQAAELYSEGYITREQFITDWAYEQELQGITAATENPDNQRRMEAT